MADREEEPDVQAIGKHCDLPHCHRLDFLPFVCESCKGTFCLDHRTETAHQCAKAGTWLASRRPPAASAVPSSSRPTPQSLLAVKCALPKCKTVVNTPRNPAVNCTVCRKQYCLTHRHQDTHDCKPPPKPAAAEASDKARDALRKFKLWGTNKSSEAKQKLHDARKPSSVIELQKMKKEAKGDEKVTPEKRIYLYVEAEARSTTSKLPKGVFWYSKDWTVGRVLDSAAKSLMVQNLNNQAEEEEKRLRVFHVEGGRILSFGEKIGDCTVNGNTIVLLRGIMMPDLIEV